MFTITKINENQFRFLDQEDEVRQGRITTIINADRNMTELELFKFFKTSEMDCLGLWEAMESMQVGKMTHASFSVSGNLVYCK